MSVKEVEYNDEDRSYVFDCPHCSIKIQVLASEIACSIFRHGTYKTTNQQVGPHTSKEECDRLVEKDSVYGCCKPFRFVAGTHPTVEVCDYI